MELIQIIYKILLAGGALLFIVISASFLIARSRKNDLKNSIQAASSLISINKESAGREFAKVLYQNKSNIAMPVVYNINPNINSGIKIVRKPTVSKYEIQEQINREERFIKRTGGLKSNKRYTIVNEEMKKSFNPTVINF